MFIYGKFVKCHLFYCIAKQGVKEDLALIKTLVQSMQKEPLISQIIICDQLSCYRSNLKDYKIPRDTKSVLIKYSKCLEEKKNVVSESGRKHKLIREKVNEIKKEKQVYQNSWWGYSKIHYWSRRKADLVLFTKANIHFKKPKPKKKTLKLLIMDYRNLRKTLKVLPSRKF